MMVNLRSAGARRVAAVALLGGVLTACSSGVVGGSNQPGVPDPQVSSAPGAADNRMSINHASGADVSAALDGVGVQDADKWGRLIAQAKPYPIEDTEQRKLREVLTSNGADPQTIDKAMASLKP